jgi:Tfp pilus assembly protein FimV
MTRTLAIGTLCIGAALVAAGCDLATLTPTTGPSDAVEATATVTASPSTPPSPSFVRPTPTPLPTFLVYVVRSGDTLSSIANAFGTKAQSVAYWNRAAYPSLDPDSSRYDPNTIKVGWTLRLIPNAEVDPEDLPPAATPSPAPSASPRPSAS